MNGDGKPDIVLQHTNGTIEVWMMDGVRRIQRTPTSPNAPGDRNWRIVGTGDFNADQRPDLVFQHSDGGLAAWYLDGTVATAGVLFSPQTSGNANMRVVSISDRNQDGKADLLFQNANDGILTVWFMDGINRTSEQLLNPSKAGGTWSVVAPK